MAAWDAGHAGRDLAGLVHHADHGSNYLALVYTEWIVELGAKPSTGTVGDSIDKRPRRGGQRPVQGRTDPPPRSPFVFVNRFLA